MHRRPSPFKEPPGIKGKGTFIYGRFARRKRRINAPLLAKKGEEGKRRRRLNFYGKSACTLGGIILAANILIERNFPPKKNKTKCRKEKTKGNNILIWLWGKDRACHVRGSGFFYKPSGDSFIRNGRTRKCQPIPPSLPSPSLFVYFFVSSFLCCPPPHSLIPPSPFSHTSSRTEVTDVPSKREGGGARPTFISPNLSGREKGKKRYLSVYWYTELPDWAAVTSYVGIVFFVQPVRQREIEPILCTLWHFHRTWPYFLGFFCLLCVCLTILKRKKKRFEAKQVQYIIGGDKFIFFDANNRKLFCRRRPVSRTRRNGMTKLGLGPKRERETETSYRRLCFYRAKGRGAGFQEFRNGEEEERRNPTPPPQPT